VWAHLPFYTILLPAFLELSYSQTAYNCTSALNSVYRVSGVLGMCTFLQNTTAAGWGGCHSAVVVVVVVVVGSANWSLLKGAHMAHGTESLVMELHAAGFDCDSQASTSAMSPSERRIVLVWMCLHAQQQQVQQQQWSSMLLSLAACVWCVQVLKVFVESGDELLQEIRTAEEAYTQ
jgi:hypothetical protein